MAPLARNCMSASHCVNGHGKRMNLPQEVVAGKRRVGDGRVIDAEGDDGGVALDLAYDGLGVRRVPDVGQRGRPVAPHHSVQLLLDGLLHRGEVDHVEEEEPEEGGGCLGANLRYIYLS